MRYLITVVIAALSLNAFGQVPDYVPSDGLVAWYPLNGDGEDFGTHELDGTVLGPQETTDRFGNLSGALSFDGIDDYLLVLLCSPLPGNSLQIYIKMAITTTLIIITCNTVHQCGRSNNRIKFICTSGGIFTKYMSSRTATYVK